MVLETLWSAFGISCQLPREVGLLADAVDWQPFSSPHRLWGVAVVQILNTVGVHYEALEAPYRTRLVDVKFQIVVPVQLRSVLLLEDLGQCKPVFLSQGGILWRPKVGLHGKVAVRLAHL